VRDWRAWVGEIAQGLGGADGLCGAHLDEGLKQVVGGAVQDVAERGEGAGRYALGYAGDQPINLALRQRDPARFQRRHQLGALPEVSLRHPGAQVPAIAEPSLLSHLRCPHVMRSVLRSLVWIAFCLKSADTDV
jgi:hypothetical protein